MSWVRYDDAFYNNPKVTAAIHEDPGSIALHVLANTWSSQQKRRDFVPQHQPAMLIGGSRRLAAKWSTIMESVGLWEPVEGGWLIHDKAEYEEGKGRTTPGTPAELSAKRRAAGSKGGKQTQQRKQSAQANDAASEHVADSPVVGTSVLRTSVPTPEPEPVPTSSARSEATELAVIGTPDTAQALIAEWIDRVPKKPPRDVVGPIAKSLKAMLAEGIDPADVRRGLAAWASKGLHPSSLPSVVNEVMNAGPPGHRPSTTDLRVAGALALAEKYREAGQ